MGERLRVRQGEAKGDEPHPQLLPDLQGREAILKVHAAKVKLAENVDFNTIDCAASGASGAKLANMVNEAALRAVRQGRRLATREDLQESIEVVIAGYQKKNKNPLRPRADDCLLPRNRPRLGGGAPDPLRPGGEDHHHPPLPFQSPLSVRLSARAANQPPKESITFSAFPSTAVTLYTPQQLLFHVRLKKVYPAPASHKYNHE